MKRLLLILAVWSGSLSVLPAQSDAPAQPVYRGLGLSFNQGVVLIHSRDIRAIRNSYPTGLEMDYFWHKTSRQAWSSCHCYPKLGVAATLWSFDHPRILGYGLTSLFYIEPVFGAGKRLSFSLRAGFGLSYQTKPYDTVTNPDNQSYSTHLAFPLTLGGKLHYRLNPRWYLDVSALYNHISNGGIKEPNKGINWPTGAIGVSRYFTAPRFYEREKLDWRSLQAPATRLDLTFFIGWNEPEKRLFLGNPGVEVKYSRQVARLNAVTLGAEWLYDNGARYVMVQTEETADPQRGGLALGHEFLLGKFIFSQQFGYYWYKPYATKDKVYQRYGLVYRAGQHLSLGINLKAHGHVADFLDVRMGWAFGWQGRDGAAHHEAAPGR
jgi:hypothetical protein